MKPVYKLRYFFDYCAGACLWSADDVTWDAFGHAVDHRRLPLTPATVARIDEMVQWFDTSIDWDDPAVPRPWQQDECYRFNAAALGLFAAIEAELGGKFEVINEHQDLSP